MSIDLLIFDLDGVLVESEMLVARSLSEQLAGIGIRADAGLIIRRFHYVPYPVITSRLAAEQGITRSEEHTSELQSLMRISYAVFCLKKKKKKNKKKENY